MRIRKAISILLAVALLLSSSTFTVFASGVQASSTELKPSSIGLKLDKTSAKTGETITATLDINNISGFAGYQVNMKYDPAVLEPVTSKGVKYSSATMPESGTILNNTDYSLFSRALNDLTAGTLNIGKAYTDVQYYKDCGIAESNGSIAIIRFKVLQEKPTSVLFENSPYLMPNGKLGTILFDWNGNKTTDYTVVQAGLINSDNQNPVTDSSVSLSFDKASAAVGETVKATLDVKNIENFAGYQINLKYDTDVLQPITSSKSAFIKNTFPTGSTILNNEDYSIFSMASNNIENGILNFTSSYSNLYEYKAGGIAETTGTLAVIEFKVLKEIATTVSFESTATMPNSKNGILLANWDGETINSGYSVIQAGILNEEASKVTDGKVSLDLDKNTAEVGDIINATLKFEDVDDFAGYQVNLTYDPAVLKPVTEAGEDYTNSKMPTDGTLLLNNDFQPYAVADNNLSGGSLNFGKSYINIKDYKAAGKAETSGTAAVVKFKVLQKKPAAILFSNSDSMVNGISGTMLFDWNGDRILSGYTVTQPAVINSQTGTDENYITLDLDKTSASVGDIVKATLNVNGITSLGGYQVNLKYDPSVLQPVDASGKAYESNTIPGAGNLINNTEYGIIPVAAHKLSAGILTFGSSYTNLDAFKADGDTKGTGTLAVINFKVLEKKATSITFDNIGSMPNAIIGTMLFDADANRITSGYEVKQPNAINSDVSGDPSNYITIKYGTNYAIPGNIVEAKLIVENIDKLAGYQVNLKYDPQAIEPVTDSGEVYSNNTIPKGGTLLANEDYGFLPLASNDIANGVLNFGKVYTDLETYKASGSSEKSGTLAVIKFKVKQVKPIKITFENSSAMPNGISGTTLMDWDAKRIISGYNVIQPSETDVEVGGGTDHCVQTPPITNTYIPVVTPTSGATDCCTPTNTIIPVTPPTKYISLDFKENAVLLGRTIEATLNVSGIDNLAGYQVNLKYDPKVIAPVTDEGEVYGNKTLPKDGSLLVNEDYGILPVVSNDTVNGILNFGKSYTNLEAYRSGKPENSGSLAVIKFKVLSVKPIKITFENTSSMPNGISGTMLFDWNSNRLSSGYTVKQPDSESIDVSGGTDHCVKTPSPSITPVSTPTAIVTPVVTPTTKVTPVVSSVPTSTVIPSSQPGTITIELDKTTAKVNDTINATVKVSNMNNLAGYQLNLKYDPKVLQPITPSNVAYTNSSIPSSGTILNNSDYGVIPAASHNTTLGYLNFGKLYTNLEDYKSAGDPENTGSLAVITFKVLSESATSIKLENSSSMPTGKSGTMLFNWDGNRITSEYQVIQPEVINSNSTATTPVATPVNTPAATPVTTATIPTPAATPTTTTTTVPSTSSSYITLDFDKTTANVGETIKATLKINKISKFMGYQVNLAYDPDVLQPVKPSGDLYKNSTIPSSGELLDNSDFGALNAVSHNLTKGILNFGKLYSLIDEYRASGIAEETGTLAVIEFKVLKPTTTTVKFENSASMPSGLNGTILFDWDGNRINSGYSVIQPNEIN